MIEESASVLAYLQAQAEARETFAQVLQTKVIGLETAPATAIEMMSKDGMMASMGVTLTDAPTVMRASHNIGTNSNSNENKVCFYVDEGDSSHVGSYSLKDACYDGGGGYVKYDRHVGC
jgi:hypothetical protein